jgi:hypothetical protein
LLTCCSTAPAGHRRVAGLDDRLNTARLYFVLAAASRVVRRSKAQWYDCRQGAPAHFYFLEGWFERGCGSSSDMIAVHDGSRNTRGADLFATDQDYKRTRSIQVKTNSKPVSFWLLSKDYKELSSPTHIYLFINLRGDARPDYYVVPSRAVKRYGTTSVVRNGGSVWHAFSRSDAENYKEKWSVFGANYYVCAREILRRLDLAGEALPSSIAAFRRQPPRELRGITVHSII